MSPLLRRISPVTFVLLCILAAGLLLRFAAYDHPLGFNGGDGIRDYVVASHALTHGAWPVVGPYNGTIHSLGNSPLYYYLIILFALLHNTMWFVNVCYILFGASSIVGIFLLTRRLFGEMPALIAAALFSFAPLYIEEAASFLWQPYLMEPVLIFGVWLFVVGYQERSEKWLSASLVAVLCALALHMSVLGFLPLYLLLGAVALWRIRGVRAFILPTVIGLGTACLLFLPDALFTIPSSAPASADVVIQTHAAGFFHEFGWALRTLVYRFDLEWTPVIPAILFGLGVWFFRRKDVLRSKKFTVLMLLLIIVQQLVAVALISQGMVDRHVIPADWAFVAVVAVILYETLLRPRHLHILGILLCILFIFHTVRSPFVAYALHNIPRFERPQRVTFEQATTAIAREVETIKKLQGYDDYHFFDVVGLRTGNFNVISITFLAPLEARFNTRYLYTDRSRASYHMKVGEDYIFLTCTQGNDAPGYTSEACRQYFISQHPTYDIVKTVYRDPPTLWVFLAARCDVGGACD